MNLKFLKDRHAVSPVIAVILMIAIAVTVAGIAYTWAAYFTGTVTNKAEKSIQIPEVYFNGENSVVYVQNTGRGQVTVAAVYVNGELKWTGSETLDEGEIASIGVSLPNDEVRVKVICEEGIMAEQVFRPS